MSELLDLNKPVTPTTLLDVITARRITELAQNAEAVIYRSGSREADRLIIENAIRTALIEAVVNMR